VGAFLIATSDWKLIATSDWKLIATSDWKLIATSDWKLIATSDWKLIATSDWKLVVPYKGLYLVFKVVSQFNCVQNAMCKVQNAHPKVHFAYNISK